MNRNRNLMFVAALVAVLVAFGSAPSMAQGVMFVTGGKVGIGIDIPVTTLHVQDSASSGQLLVENTVDVGNKAMFILRNAGVNRFQFENSTTGNKWLFQTDVANRLIFSLFGSGGEEVGIDASGNMTVRGNVTANGVLLTSSKASKTDFAPINNQEVLERVVSLPVSAWRYKTEAEGVQHIGPFAEDFNAAFGLGSDAKRISMVDAAGITLAAVQGLHSQLEQKDEELRALSQELAELRAMVEALSN